MLIFIGLTLFNARVPRSSNRLKTLLMNLLIKILCIFTQSFNSRNRMTLKERVEQALDSIRPYLETDGGNVSVEEITDDNVVRLKLLGTCANCAMSIMTFKAGLEQAIKKAVPEIVAVEAINLTDISDPNAITPGQL